MSTILHVNDSVVYLIRNILRTYVCIVLQSKTSVGIQWSIPPQIDHPNSKQLCTWGRHENPSKVFIFDGVYYRTNDSIYRKRNQVRTCVSDENQIEVLILCSAADRWKMIAVDTHNIIAVTTYIQTNPTHRSNHSTQCGTRQRIARENGMP